MYRIILNISFNLSYGYSDTVSFTPYEDGVTKSAVVAAPDSGVRIMLIVVLGTRLRPDVFIPSVVVVAPTFG